ncbi:MAG: DUF2796 domain-containing protein [Marinobacter sp.]|nr:DUF2796 domain-containing protein [Marinobacter sp.]
MTPRTPLKSINSLNVAISLCLCALATASTANEQQPHQHGHAQLQMAVENNSIDLILTSPAHNLLGIRVSTPYSTTKKDSGKRPPVANNPGNGHARRWQLHREIRQHGFQRKSS